MRFCRILGLIVALVVSASATPITFTHSGTASGTIDSTAFVDAAFTITALGDTNNLQLLGFALFIDHDSASISIDGVGDFSFITGTRTFLSGSTVGFSRAGEFGADLADGPTDAGLAPWDMLTPIGPFTGAGSILQWSNTPVLTNGAVLQLDNAGSIITFQASTDGRPTTVPEPSSVTLLSLGLVGALIRLKGRRRANSTK